MPAIPKGLVLTTHSPEQLKGATDLAHEFGCTFSIVPDPEDGFETETAVVVTGTFEQLQALHAAGNVPGLWGA